MDKNTLTGFILIAAVLIGFSYFSRPGEAEIEARHRQDSIEAVARRQAIEEQKAKEAADLVKEAQTALDSTSLFYANRTGESRQIILENELIRLTFNTRGGTVQQAELKEYKNQEGNPVTLFDANDARMQLMLAGKAENICSGDYFFTPVNVSDTTLTMRLQNAEGKTLDLNYTLIPHSYMVNFTVSADGLGNFFAPSLKTMDIEWNERARQQEKGFDFESRYSSLTYKIKNEGTDYLSESSTETENITTPLDWVAFKNQFFSAVLISKDGIAANSLMTSIPQEKGSGYLKHYEAKMKTAFDPSGAKPTEFEMFIGPNDFRLLSDIEDESAFGKELELQQLVYLGWPLFRIINRWFTLYVFDWLTGFGLNMGIVLILITLLLKVITFPMVKKSYMSSAKMRVLRPKLEEATKQYDKPEDQMQKQQAMMALYSKYGVSPLSGCLPMLIQMPIWIAMFNFVPNAIQLRGESFLWISDLSTYDPIWEWNTNLWLIGDHLSLTCILFCVANVLYSIMSMRQQRDQMVGQQAEQMKMMQWMMYLMPVMFFFMFNDYSAGLNFYYFISLFFSAAIMWTLRKTTDDAKLLSILEARYKENEKNPKKTSGLAARLEAMQKQAAEIQRQQREMQNKRK